MQQALQEANSGQMSFISRRRMIEQTIFITGYKEVDSKLPLNIDVLASEE